MKSLPFLSFILLVFMFGCKTDRDERLKDLKDYSCFIGAKTISTKK